MPADPTTQNALIIIAAALVIQTLLMVCTVIAMAIAWKRAQAMIDARLGHVSTRLDDVVAQTRMAVGAIERSAAQVDTVFHDAGHILRTVTTAVAVPRHWLMAGAASAASAFARWRRTRRQQQQPYAAAAR
jgi:F0F1-type ATP synthase assembly protein I